MDARSWFGMTFVPDPEFLGGLFDQELFVEQAGKRYRAYSPSKPAASKRTLALLLRKPSVFTRSALRFRRE